MAPMPVVKLEPLAAQGCTAAGGPPLRARSSMAPRLVDGMGDHRCIKLVLSLLLPLWLVLGSAQRKHATHTPRSASRTRLDTAQSIAAQHGPAQRSTAHTTQHSVPT